MEREVRYKISFGGALTPAVKVLIIINSAVFLLALLAKGNPLIRTLGLVPGDVISKRYFWQPVTYMFLHANFIHILMNMLGLWWFGCDVERSFGSKFFLRYYFFTGIGAGIVAALMGWGSPIPIIGASGAIFGILLAYAFIYPNRIIYLYFIFPVKAKWVVLIFALVQLFATLEGNISNISHEAHIGGIIFGLLWFGYYLKVFTRQGMAKIFRRRNDKRELRIVDPGTDKDDDFFDGNGEGTIH